MKSSVVRGRKPFGTDPQLDYRTNDEINDGTDKERMDEQTDVIETDQVDGEMILSDNETDYDYESDAGM